MHRQSLVWLGLALTLIACWWVDRQEQEVTNVASMGLSNAVPTFSSKAPKLSAVPTQQHNHELRQADTSPLIDLFSPLIMPTEATSATALPSVTEPMNPYTYDGRLLDGTQWIVFLTDGTQQFALREGERFANGWKVRRLTDHQLVLQNGKTQYALQLTK